jgi:hypothetical protein
VETGRRRFYGGDQLETAIFVTNDDDRFKDHQDLKIEMMLVNDQGAGITNSIVGSLARLPYYETRQIPLQLSLPQPAANRQKLNLVLRLLENGSELGRATEPVEVFARPAPMPKVPARFIARNLGPELARLLEPLASTGNASEQTVIVADLKNDPRALEPNSELRQAIDHGATAILLSVGTNINLGDSILDVKDGEAEFADWVPISGTTLASGLEPMDLKWWGRLADNRTFIGSQSHRLKPGGPARELLRYIPPHSYISADKVPEQYRTVLFELPLGKGRLWICDLDLEQSVSVDPAARLFTGNLLRAAADPNSTARLPKIPSHEELLKRSVRN